MTLSEETIDKFYEALGAHIRDARTAKAITQDALAKRAGLTRASISNIESGRQKPPAHILFLIAHTLGTPTDSLMPQIEIETLADMSALDAQLVGHDESTRDFVRSVVSQRPKIEDQ